MQTRRTIPIKYRQKREQLMANSGNWTAIFRSAPVAVMHNDVEYADRQDSDFFYLSGFNEAQAVAVLAPHHEEQQVTIGPDFTEPQGGPARCGLDDDFLRTG